MNKSIYTIILIIISITIVKAECITGIYTNEELTEIGTPTINKMLGTSGEEIESNGSTITNYIELDNTKDNKLISDQTVNGMRYCRYNTNKELIGNCNNVKTSNINITLEGIENEIKYIRITINQGKTVTLNGTICKNEIEPEPEDPEPEEPEEIDGEIKTYIKQIRNILIITLGIGITSTLLLRRLNY